MRLRLLTFLAAALTATLFCAAEAAPPAVPQTFEQLKEDRLKQLYRREPRAREYVQKLQQKIAGLRSSKNSAGAAAQFCTADTIESRLDQIILGAAALSEDRLSNEVDFLADLAGPMV